MGLLEYRLNSNLFCDTLDLYYSISVDFFIFFPSFTLQNVCCGYSTLCIWETPKWVLLQTVKTQMKCHTMQHFIRAYTVCKGKKDLQTKIQYFLKINSLTPLDMYNGISQLYCLKPEVRIHLYTKGYKNCQS